MAFLVAVLVVFAVRFVGLTFCGFFGVVVATLFGTVVVVLAVSFVSFAVGRFLSVVVPAVVRGGLSVGRQGQREQADEERRAFTWLREWIDF